MPATKSKNPVVAPGATINFIPNDPVVSDTLPIRVISPSPDRPAARAAFAFKDDAGAAAQYPPGTEDFVFWQSREAALQSIAAVEAAAGSIAAWAAKATSPLPLHPNDGEDTGAFYNRRALLFFKSAASAGSVFSAASTDCVAHEVGHAILDSIRPDLFDIHTAEHTAFHESFADCVSLITALADRATRQALLDASRDLSESNVVEALAEDLARARLLQLGPDDPFAQPRHARNAFQWALPTTLPISAPPSVLTADPHSFSRIFTGCFYDLLRKIFNTSASQSESALDAATKTSAKLLVEGARHAVEGVRFFEAVGIAMLDQDEQDGGGNGQHIRDAFANHGIALASSAVAFRMRANLAGRWNEKGGAVSASAVRTALRERLRAVAPLSSHHIMTAAGPATKFVHTRPVDLTGVSPHLDGVVSLVPEPVVAGDHAMEFVALRSAMPDPHTTEDEARFFAAMLARTGRIQPLSTRKSGGTRSDHLDSGATHVIRTVGKRRVLTRARFACGCHGESGASAARTGRGA